MRRPCKIKGWTLSSPTLKAFSEGSLLGAIYTYQKDDALPNHVHDENNNHVTFILHGAFRCTGNPAIEGKILKRGDFIKWPVGQVHGFIALMDNSRMLQLQTKQSSV